MSRQIGVKRKRYQKYDVQTLTLAVEAVRQNKMSLRKASVAYSIPRATLYDKIKGRSPFQSPSRTVLTSAEEDRLVNWSNHIARIGFGRTRGEILNTVKAIIDMDGRPNPFKDNRPGKDWWYAFLKRHPQMTERTPQALGKERAIITPQRVERWFDDYKKYILEELKEPSLLLDPSRLYNADESGFSLCPKTGKVFAKKGCSTVYNFTSSDKTQMTVLACMGATGHYIKPLIVFPGQRFTYNPLEGFEEAVFGRTENGWMDSTLFLTWLKDVFVPSIDERGVQKPVVLFVDGHSTHMSLEVSDLCKQHGIELYCLLEHASHLLQPCDLRLFSGLKDAWRQAVRDYQFKNVGEYVTKKEFASVFKGAWEKSTTVSVAVNGFRDAGLFPLDPSKVLGTIKMEPSKIFTQRSKSTPTSSITETLSTAESEPEPEKAPSRNSEVNKPVLTETDVLSDSSNTQSDHTTAPGVQAESAILSNDIEIGPSGDNIISPSVSTILTIPVVKSTERVKPKRQPLPKAITGEKFRELLKEREERKRKLEEEKNERKLVRELNKKKKEEDKERKLKEKEEKKKKREELKREKLVEKKLKQYLMSKRKHRDSDSEDSDQMSDLSDGSSDDGEFPDSEHCFECHEAYDDSPFWINCHKCPRKFHQRCVKSIDLCVMSEEQIEDLMFECDYC